SSDLMMVLVSAGLALGLTGGAHITASREQGVVARPLTGGSPMLTTYLLRPASEPSEILTRFMERVHSIKSPDAKSRR
ncbi:LysR family transcriptional regulator, partial [Pseudomonas aeruginosa]